MDLIFQVLPQEAARLAKNPNLVVYTPPSARVIWIYLNTQKEPLRDKRVREALYYAIDRGGDREEHLRGDRRPPLAGPGRQRRVHRGVRPVRLQPREALLLREAGQPALSFAVHHSPGRYLLSGQVLEALQAYWRQVGVTMKIVDLEWGTLPALRAVRGQEPDPGGLRAGARPRGTSTARSALPLAPWRPAGNNLSFYKNEEFDRLLDAEQGAPRPEEARRDPAPDGRS